MRDEERKPPVSMGEVIAGKYRVDELLGAGGMGVVVAATHTAIDQRVALKFILPGALKGPESVERFLREAKASVRLKGEHIARVYDVGTLATGEPFIVMELLEGADLAKLARRQAPVASSDACEYVLQACEALIEAHANGIIHRDLKPQNLFVTRRMNGTPLVKVLDFGIFKATGPAAIGQLSLTDSTVVLGSPLYMAPEQMRAARNADARSDVWSLGVILYELLAGRVPFDGETVTELCLKVTTEPPAPLVQLRDGLPADLVAIVMRCLEKEPVKRYATVAQLAAALEPFSTSGQRGVLDRPWRSLVDTVDQLQVPDSLRSPSQDKAGTGVTWGATGAGAGSKPAAGKRRGFVGGVAVGVVVSLAAAIGAYVVATRRPPPPSTTAAIELPAQVKAPSVAPPAAPPPPAIEPSALPIASAVASAPPPVVRPASTPRPRPGKPAAATPAAAPPVGSVAPPPTAAPAPPAAPAAANGAPILN
jgi:eukaryotic-like serine/threonine-protein kinase